MSSRLAGSPSKPDSMTAACRANDRGQNTRPSYFWDKASVPWVLCRQEFHRWPIRLVQIIQVSQTISTTRFAASRNPAASQVKLTFATLAIRAIVNPGSKALSTELHQNCYQGQVIPILTKVSANNWLGTTPSLFTEKVNAHQSPWGIRKKWNWELTYCRLYPKK
jgi:hypothetical protein